MDDSNATSKPSTSPKKRNKPGKRVGSGQRNMIINLYKDLMERDPQMKYESILDALTTSSGIGKTTIMRTLAEYKRTGSVSSPAKSRTRKQLFDNLDDFQKQGLRQKIHSFWLRRELPTLDKILIAVNDDPNLNNYSRTSLHRILLKMQFVYSKRKRNSVLTEREDLINWRRNYLYDIRSFRKQNRPIYYLDETWINAGDTLDTVWQDLTVKSKHDAFNRGLSTGAVNPTGKGKRLIILHIGSNTGFVPGGLLCFESKKNSMDYHDEMNGDNFKEWFENVLPKLERNSVIVMDNAPYHSVKLEKVPTSAWKKQDILVWLQSKGEKFDRPMLKTQLMIRVKQIKDKYNDYVIDTIAKAAGHTVLRLPPYHCEFNPIELAWSMVKQYVKQNNTTFKISDVKNLLLESINRVTPENWSNFIKHVIEEENKIWEVDDIMDEIIDNMEPCVLTITGETSSDSFSDFDD